MCILAIYICLPCKVYKTLSCSQLHKNWEINAWPFVHGTHTAYLFGENVKIISSGPMKSFPFSMSEALVILENEVFRCLRRGLHKTTSFPQMTRASQSSGYKSKKSPD
jgi:hypothetical protein